MPQRSKPEAEALDGQSLAYAASRLSQGNSGQDDDSQRPIARRQGQGFPATPGSRRLIRAIGRGTVGQRAVDEERLGAAVLADVDDALVQGRVAAIAYELVVESRAVVLVTRAHGELGAAAEHLGRLILVRCSVVEAVKVGVGIHVRSVRPETGPKGQSSNAEGSTAEG